MEQSKMIIKRNLLFWGKYGIQMTAILIGFVLRVLTVDSGRALISLRS